MFKCLNEYLNEKLSYRDLPYIDISHFKAFVVTNLQYEIRIHQKIYRKSQYTIALGMFFYGTDVMCDLNVRTSKVWIL